jgi:SAM-dependent methyltransferase
VISYAVPPPGSATRLPLGRHARGCLGEALRAAARLPGRQPRTPGVSLAEYERRWAATADQARWLSRPAELDRAVELSSYDDATLHALIESVPYQIGAPAFFRWRADKLAAVFGAHYPPSTPITEIGCGTGKNLLVLARAGYTRLAGFDPAAPAIRAVRAQADRYGLQIETGRFDLLSPDREILTRLHGRVLFTNHVLEQLPRQVPDALDCLLRAAPREVVHIEPCTELLRPWRSATDLASLLHARASDYQRTLLRELTRLRRAGRITILEVAGLGYAPRPRSTPTLVRWRPAHR